MTVDAFHHRHERATESGWLPLLLLHGTGGSEDDLLPLGRAVAPGAALLAPRGRVREGSMTRFFRRFSEGVLDEDDVIRRTHELADWVAACRTAYDLEAPVAIGFSNGANIAASTLMLRPEVLSGAALLRAMMPLASPAPFELPGTPVLLLSGQEDPMVPAGHAGRLADALQAAGGDVTHTTFEAGHGLTQEDLGALRTWVATFARR